MEKMTKRNVYEAMIDGMKTGHFRYEAEEIIAFFENEIELLDKRTEKSRANRSKKVNTENETLRNLIYEALSTEEYATIDAITKSITEEFPEATNSRVSYQLNQLVKDELVEKKGDSVASTNGGRARRVQTFRKFLVED